jgi:VIT1/CCC1 family predicted Fe2+/Mn2+ transporter
MLFGLIMVLTFTGSLSVAESNSNDVRTMLIGALGCNFAWAVIDALFYLMGSLSEKGSRLGTYRAVRSAGNAQMARELIAGTLPPFIAELLDTDQLESLRQRLVALPAPPHSARLTAADWLGALAVFLLVFLATFPVAIPFMLFQDVGLAMRASNGVAVAMLFLAGIAYGRCIGRSPVGTAVAMVILGVVVVAFTIAFGG